MKAYEIVGWAFSGSIYCADCQPLRWEHKAHCLDNADCRDSDCSPQPVFACDSDDDWSCDACGVNGLTGEIP